MFKTFPKTHITIAAAATVVVVTAVLMSPSADVEARRMSIALDLESGTAATVVATPPAVPASLAPGSTSKSNPGIEDLNQRKFKPDNGRHASNRAYIRSREGPSPKPWQAGYRLASV
ncbi:MAG: hypothetical protein MH219_02365 [Marinobacter sp.]|nr:hypothetical protein [Marinobacter sp.]